MQKKLIDRLIKIKSKVCACTEFPPTAPDKLTEYATGQAAKLSALHICVVTQLQTFFLFSLPTSTAGVLLNVLLADA
jgi:hypothetical protein